MKTIRINGYECIPVESENEIFHEVLKIDRPKTGQFEIFETYVFDDYLYHVNMTAHGELYLHVEAIYEDEHGYLDHYTIYPIVEVK